MQPLIVRVVPGDKNVQRLYDAFRAAQMPVTRSPEAVYVTVDTRQSLSARSIVSRHMADGDRITSVL